jgi:hypothetical protein
VTDKRGQVFGGPRDFITVPRELCAPCSEIGPGGFIQEVQGQHVGDCEPGEFTDVASNDCALDAPGRQIALEHALDLVVLVVEADRVTDLGDERVAPEGRSEATQGPLMRWPWSRRPTPPAPSTPITAEQVAALRHVVGRAIEMYDEALQPASVTDPMGPLHVPAAYEAIVTRPALLFTALLDRVPDAQLRPVVLQLLVLSFAVWLDRDLVACEQRPPAGDAVSLAVRVILSFGTGDDRSRRFLDVSQRPHTVDPCRRSLVAEPLQNRGPERGAVDRLRQVRVKARRPHARGPRAGRD